MHDEFPDEQATYIVFTSQPEDRRSKHQERHEVGVVAANPARHMHWSEKPISWSRADHPEVMPSPGSYALVLEATLATDRRAARFSRVLIDGGSSINILYRDTLEKLNIKTKQLMPTRTVFHGIVPGLSCAPIGKIKIDVLFGDKVISAEKRSGLKWWTWRAPTMHCLADLPWPGSWLFPTMLTSR